MQFRPLPNVLWNLLLALVPVLLGFVIARGLRREWRARGHVRWLLWTPLLLVWLAFLSNTCYLLTEWRHYLETISATQVYFAAGRNREAAYDLLLETSFYIFYSGSGLLTFFLSLWPLDRLARHRLGRAMLPLHALIFLFCSLGVYLGLVHRFNSWDLLRPHRALAVLQTLTDALSHPVLVALILGFGAILWLLYTVFDIWMDGAAWRLTAHRERRTVPIPVRLDDTLEDLHHASL